MSALPWMIGGGALSGLGSILGGAGQGRAGRQARDFYDQRTGQRVTDMLRSLYGQAGVDFYNQSASPGGVQAGTQSAFDQISGGPLIGQMRQNARFANNRGGQMVNRFDNQTGALAQTAGQRTGMVDQLARGNEALAASWGHGRDNIIRQDAKSQLGTLNSQSRGALMGAGLGNTSAVASQMGANSIGVNREMQRALQTLSEGQIDRSMGARSQRMDLNQRMGEAQNQRDYQRESDRLGLTQGNLNRTLAMRDQPIQTQLQMLQGQVFNPLLGQGTSQYYPGNGGVASALGNIGGAAFGVGSYIQGQNDLQRLLEQLRRGA